MWIIIAGTVIASMISSVLLLSAVATGKRGDEWTEETYEQPAPAPKAQRFNKTSPHGAR